VSNPKLDEASAGVAAALEATSTFLTETSEVLDTLPSETKEARPALYRAEAAVENGRSLVGVIDPRVVPQTLADEIRNQAEEVRDQVRLVPDDGGDVGPAAEELLARLMRLRQPGEVEQKAKEISRRFAQSLGGRLRGVEGEMKAAEDRVAQMAEQTTTQTEEVKQRLDELKAESDAAKERVDGLIGEQDKKFTDAQEERRKRFDDSLEAAKSTLSDTQQELEARRDEAVQRIKDIEEDLANTAAALGGRASAMGHGKESDQQAKRAFWWSVAAIALLLAAAAIPIRAGILDADQSLESVIGKTVIALILGAVAGYAANIAKHHRQRAATARRLELEMASFGPFIAPLEPDDQKDLRGAIVWRFYGPEVEPQEPDGPPRPGSYALDWIRRRRNGRTDPAQNETPPVE
jgi:hypothetical protein